MDTENPEGTWAVVELFGHQKIAGRVVKDDRYGVPMVRVDVPEVAANNLPGIVAHTAFFGQGAIYAIHPVDERIARSVAGRERHSPVQAYTLSTSEIQAMLAERTGARQLAIKTESPDDGDLEDEYEDGLD